MTHIAVRTIDVHDLYWLGGTDDFLLIWNYGGRESTRAEAAAK
jgi:hypothetical protein